MCLTQVGHGLALKHWIRLKKVCQKVSHKVCQKVFKKSLAYLGRLFSNNKCFITLSSVAFTINTL
jgi:hypothetical protein